MKKKFLKDKVKKNINNTSLKDKLAYCIKFSKNLESIFEPLGHDHRDYQKMEVGEFFLNEAVNYDYEGTGEETNYIMVCEKVSNKECLQYFLEEEKHINRLYKRLKELGK
jgi:hypothetical protein